MSTIMKISSRHLTGMRRRSLVSFIMNDHVIQAGQHGIPYVYLGYWVQGSPKMDYKARFRPVEVLNGQTWVVLSERERMDGALIPSMREYYHRFGLDAEKLASAKPDAIVMHPGPMNRGMEIAAEVADSARSTIVDQVGNGVSVRMAVLYLLLGGAPGSE